MSITAIYPGTFDPITRGHLHIVRRACRIVDKLIVSVSENRNKNPIFSVEERVAMAKADIAAMNGLECEVEVQGFETLLIHHARDCGASHIVRGLRAVSDFEYEFHMTGMNLRLNPDIDSIFLMTSEKWQFVSSSFVKEISRLDGDISKFVTARTRKALANKKSPA